MPDIIHDLKKIIKDAKEAEKAIRKIKNHEDKELELLTRSAGLIKQILELDLDALNKFKKEKGVDDLVAACEDLWLAAEETKESLRKQEYDKARKLLDQIIELGRHELLLEDNLELPSNWDFDADYHVPGFHLHIRYDHKRTKWKLTFNLKERKVYFEQHSEDHKVDRFPNDDGVRDRLRKIAKKLFESYVSRGGLPNPPSAGAQEF